MATSWNWDLFDEFLATDISKFTEAVMPPLLHDEAEHWLSNYFLNSAIGTSFISPTREFAFTFVRRTSVAFEEYQLASSVTADFLARRSQGMQPTRTYLSGLHHWEQCVANAWQAIEAWRRLTKLDAFTKGDGSVEERLNVTYNRSKHTDGAIAADQMPSRGPLAMWMSNEGLRTVESLVSWDELVDVLDELAQAADVFQFPEGFRAVDE